MVQHLIPDKRLNNGVYLYGALIDESIKELQIARDILHVELGYGEYELFWQTRRLIKQKPSTKLVITIHDAPMVIGKPFAKWLSGDFILTKLIRKGLDLTLGKYVVAGLVRRANAIIVLNPLAKDLVSTTYGISQDRIVVSSLPSLAAVPARKRKKDDILRILYFGNISPRKGLDVLVKALYSLRADKIQVDVIGSSQGNESYADTIKQLVGSLSENITVQVHGFVEPSVLGQYIADADIVVLPYREEGVVHASGPLATSMSAGKAIICSDVRAFAEVIDGKTGLVFQEDDVQALAECLNRLSRDPKLRKTLGEAAADWSKETTSKAAIRKTLQEVYNSL